MSDTTYLLDNVKATAPRNEVGTGTIETNKLGVIGTGTLFKEELKVGSYIIDFANDEMKRVVEVQSDTYAILESAFTTDLSASSQLDYIPAWKTNARAISAIVPVYQEDNTTENTYAVIDGANVAPGIGLNDDKANRDRSSGGDMVKPIIIDATVGGGTQVLVKITF